MFKRRYATLSFPNPNSGLKSTATIALSLRDNLRGLRHAKARHYA
jgi:hypothetical protein